MIWVNEKSRAEALSGVATQGKRYCDGLPPDQSGLVDPEIHSVSKGKIGAFRYTLHGTLHETLHGVLCAT